MAKEVKDVVVEDNENTISDDEKGTDVPNVKDVLTLEEAVAKIGQLEVKSADLEKNRNKAATKLRQFEKAATKAEEDALVEQGAWKELSEKQTEKLTALELELDVYRVDSVLDVELLKAFGENNLGTAKTLLDRNSLKRAEDGSVIMTSIAEAIDQVKEKHPILAGETVKPTPSVVPASSQPTKGGYIEELKGARTLRETQAIRAKYGKDY